MLPIEGGSLATIEAGWMHTCSVSVTGKPYCWGIDQNGEVGNGAPTADYTSPQAVDLIPVTTSQRFTLICAGEADSCGLAADGVPWCWGRDLFGALGNGSLGSSDSPGPIDYSQVTGSTTFKHLSAGAYGFCGLTAEGVAYCWGRGGDGQTGDGTGTGSNFPVPVDTSGL
jgi:alpha-tubulin suppressor-like RCC1 family protein